MAYRYFATPKRKFIIADTPGHEQYTRNMATGASTAQLAIVLVDARKGVLPQSRRHAYIASLLGYPHVVVAVNKMDLVDYSEEVFHRICDDFREFARDLHLAERLLHSDQRARGRQRRHRSPRTPWYRGGACWIFWRQCRSRRQYGEEMRFPCSTSSGRLWISVATPGRSRRA